MNLRFRAQIYLIMLGLVPTNNLPIEASSSCLAVKRLMKEAAELSTPTSDYQVICTKLFLSSGIHPKVKII